MMEECNALICDCIIVSCCCPCLILRVAIFVFLQLPRRMVRKMKEYTKRKFRRKKKKKQGGGDHANLIGRKQRQVDDDDDDDFDVSLKILELEGMKVNELHKWGSCTEEVDKVLGELAFKGEFGFGSFWGRKAEIETKKCYCKCSRSLTKEDELEFGSHVVKFHIIEVIGPISSSSS